MTATLIPDGPHILKPGEYGKWAHDSTWYFCSPSGLLANLFKHVVEEHADGTITVSPSILVQAGKAGEWHGFLERGIAREC